jgi:Phospholipase_D-nuclease N-terminal
LEFIFGLIVLGLDIWAIVNVIGSAASTLAKILWALLIIILPVLGFIIWFFVGPRSSTRAA